MVTKLQKIAAKFKKNAMAFDRDSFKNRLGEYIVGANREFYKARLAEKNGFTKWVEHWNNEVYRLLQIQLAGAFDLETKSSFDKKKAFDEVVEYCKSRDKSLRTKATNVIKTDFNVTQLKESLTDVDFEEFWNEVERVANKNFSDD